MLLFPSTHCQTLLKRKQICKRPWNFNLCELDLVSASVILTLSVTVHSWRTGARESWTQR